MNASTPHAYLMCYIANLLLSFWIVEESSIKALDIHGAGRYQWQSKIGNGKPTPEPSEVQKDEEKGGPDFPKRLFNKQ